MKENFLNIEICEKCGGKCCKEMPGSAYPEDFKKPLSDSLLIAFNSGNWAIDWWEGDPTDKDNLEKAYYIRPRTKDNKNLFDPSWGGECIFLAKNGCILEPGERPKSCRLLEPKENKSCIQHGESKRGAAIAWLPYANIILEVTKNINGWIK